MNKTIGILAHVDAGKTTFSEQLLYHTNSIKQKGRVDHKDAFLDNHTIEKARGITIFADQAVFTYNDTTYFLIDTPGHADFSSEMERALQVLDYCIVIISAVEGVEGHTETVWQLLQKYNTPAFLFINKMDREGADAGSVLHNIRENLSENVCDFTTFYEQNVFSEEQKEFIAERDEQLLEAYLNDQYDLARWKQTLVKLIRERQIFACCSGSALQDTGMETFLAGFDQLTSTDYTRAAPFAAHIYKIRYDANKTRLTFMKALSGSVQVRNEISYGSGMNRKSDKITQIRLYNGKDYEFRDHAAAGELFAVTGLQEAKAGDRAGEGIRESHFEMISTLKSKVIFNENDIHMKDVWNCFHILDAEDPSLQVLWDEHFQAIYIHVSGVIQLEVLEEFILERFHFHVTFAEPEILYKETIASTVMGYGHFEPLKHYAEVHLKLEPGEKGSGITCKSECHPNDLTPGNQNLIQHHLLERAHRGILTGSDLTDVSITLMTGRAHNKHTSGGDFREAAYRALRQGLEKAQNRLLEPYYQFSIKVHLDHMGRIMSDIQQASGICETPVAMGSKVELKGRVPVASFMNYHTEFKSLTHGKGIMNLQFCGYDKCHNEKEIIAKIGYNKDADPEYTSSSIFCAKGQGYTVPWEQAEGRMHCLD